MIKENMQTELTQEEYFRYARHLVLPEIGIEGQTRLKQSSVLIVGVGGLGSPIALYLAAAGIGHLGLVDYDSVEESNLQRQIIHGAATIGKPKGESARSRIRDINPLVDVDVYSEQFNSVNAQKIAESYQILIDGTDNLPTRYLLNDLAVMTKKTFVYGSVFRFEGQVSVFDGSKGPCYRCLFPVPPEPGMIPSCQTGGVLGVVPGIIGTIEALQAIKIITGIGDPLIGKLLVVDALDLEFRSIAFEKSPTCPICADSPKIKELIDYEQFCGSKIDSTFETNNLLDEHHISTIKLFELMKENVEIQLVDVRVPAEVKISNIRGSYNILPEQLMNEAKRWKKDEMIIIYCRTGIRSAKAVDKLTRAGYSNVWNLQGGINAWAREIDHSLMQY